MKKCETCGKELTDEQANRHKERAKPPRFCSRACFFVSLRGVAPVEANLAPRKPATTHGHTRKGQSPTYKVWHGMKQRCLNPNHINYTRYGGRGIAVCERWLDFACFLADMGERPKGMTLDRIDPEGGYNPENCRWATQKQQCNNWSRSHQFVVRYKGDEYSLQELADKFGLDRYTLRRRITTSRWPEDMWHLPPNRHLRPDRHITSSDQHRKVLPQGRT